MSGRRRLWLPSGCVLALLLCGFFGANRARAQLPPARAEGPAQQRLASGRAFLSKGDLPRALRDLEQAYEQGAGPEALALLGQVAVRQGQTTRAADLYRRALNDTGGTDPEAAAMQTLIQKEQETAAEIAVLGPAGALLRIDDRVVGRLPLSTAVLLAPGLRHLKLEDPSAPRPKVHDHNAVSGIPATVRFIEGSTSSVDAVETRPPVVLVLYDQSARPPAGPAAVLRALLDKVRQDGQAYDLPAERSARALGGETAGCASDPLCVQKLARKLSASHVLQVQLTAPRYALQVVDVSVDVPAAAPQVVDCGADAEPACAAAVGEAVTALLSANLSRQHGRLSVSTRPPTARIAVNDQPLTAVTPAELSLVAGDQQLTFRKPGFLTKRTQVTVNADATTPLSLDLEVNVAAQRRHRYAIGKTVLAVASALAIAGGAAAIGCNGLQRTVDADPNHYQELLSWPHGLAAASAAVVFLGVSLWMYRKERAAAREALAAEW